MPYRAPVKDIRFILDHVVGFAEVMRPRRGFPRQRRTLPRRS